MAVDITSLVDAYVNRLGIQYRDKPKARALCSLFVQAALADGVPLQLSDAFDLTQAVGPQLDILGKYIGSTRSVLTTLNTAYFGFVLDDGSSTNTNGFQDDNNGYIEIGQVSSDDFESYTPGAITTLAGGYGWYGVGQSIPVEVLNIDDFESYTPGAITAPSASTILANSVAWAGSGYALNF